MRPAILTDVTKCIGCEECVVACKKVNHLQPDVPRLDQSLYQPRIAGSRLPWHTPGLQSDR